MHHGLSIKHDTTIIIIIIILSGRRLENFQRTRTTFQTLVQTGSR